jgi:hypothetical protein
MHPDIELALSRWTARIYDRLGIDRSELPQPMRERLAIAEQRRVALCMLAMQLHLAAGYPYADCKEISAMFYDRDRRPGEPLH